MKTFDGPTPPLTGSEALDLTDLASVASSLIGIPVTRDTLSDDAFREKAKERGWPEAIVGTSFGYYEASRRGEFGKVDPTLENLIGRRPKTMSDVLQAATDNPAGSWSK